MKAGTFDKLAGDVEADETFIGGKARFMHRDKRAAKIHGTGGMDKSAVMGLLERHGPDGYSRVRVKPIANRKKKTLTAEVRQHVEPGANLYTDALASYEGLTEFEHGVIDHAESYVRGKVHTNGLENFWSLLKRAIKGTYVSVEPFRRSISPATLTKKSSASMSGAIRTATAVVSPRCSAESRGAGSTTRRLPASRPWRRREIMSKKPPDPSPPPEESEENLRFKNLLRRLVAVPKEELNALKSERQKRKRRRKRPGS